MTGRKGVEVTPWDVALRMMRNNRDAGLIAAYLAEEARRAGVDPLDLSMHRADRLARAMRKVAHSAWQIKAAAESAQSSFARFASVYVASPRRAGLTNFGDRVTALADLGFGPP